MVSKLPTFLEFSGFTYLVGLPIFLEFSGFFPYILNMTLFYKPVYVIFYLIGSLFPLAFFIYEIVNLKLQHVKYLTFSFVCQTP